MAVPSSGFPLLVEGSWGTEPPENLKTMLHLYFQRTNKSGGGECEIHQEPGSPPHFRVVFILENVRQRVLDKGNHELVFSREETYKLTLKLPTTPEKVPEAAGGKIPRHEFEDHVGQSGACEELNTMLCVNREPEKVGYTPEKCASLSSLVVFENLKDDVSEVMLFLLVENISGLSNDDFEVDVIQAFHVAVVTFKKYIDVMKFVDDCAKNPRMKQLQLSARLLEVTKTIRVENLPPGIDQHDLKVFFENPQNGGGRVENVECFPEESSALVEFFDRKVLDTVLTRKLELNHTPLSVFLYSPSLGTALYGKKKPLSSLPAPFKEMLPLLVWKFLRTRKHLTEEINEKMKQHHCELTWSSFSAEVTFNPVASLLSQGRNKIQTWQKDTSMAFSEIKSRYKVTSFELDETVWDSIKDDLYDAGLLVRFSAVLEMLSVVGKAEDVQNFERKLQELMEGTAEETETVQPNVTLKLSISPGKYSLLYHSGVLEHLRADCPEVEIFYDESTQHMVFKGLCADVYKTKSQIQEKVLSMPQKNLLFSPEIVQFLQETDRAEFSKSFFIEQKILAVYEIKGTAVLLTSLSPEVLVTAEEKMISSLSFKCLDVEDKRILSGKEWNDLTSSLWWKYNFSSMTVLISVFTSEATAEVIVAGCVREVNEVHGSLFNFLEKSKKIATITRLVQVNCSFVFHYLKNEKKSLWLEISKTHVQVHFNPDGKQNTILLTGPKTEVLEAIDLVTQVQDSVCVRRIQIDKPGARQFFQDNAYRAEIRRLFDCFVELLENEAKDTLPSLSATVQPNMGNADGTRGMFWTPEGLLILLVEGDVQNALTDVVVNSIPSDLALNRGPLSQALLNKAGPQLQEELNTVGRGVTGETGNIFLTSGYNLSCSHVLHVVPPDWSENRASACKLMKAIIRECLHITGNLFLKSVTFPAIGTGSLGFPKAVFAELVISEAFKFSKECQTTLQEVHLMLHPSDCIQALSDQLVQRIHGNYPSDKTFWTEDAQELYGAISKPRINMYEMKIGPITYQVVRGDITNEVADVIVNSVLSTFWLKSGLSKAILKGAGKKVKKECSHQVQNCDRKYIVTDGGLLRCKTIIHIIGADDVKNSVISVLQECAKRNYSSICLPAIGTGRAKKDPRKVADDIMDAIEDFVQEGAIQFVRTVKVVIDQYLLLNDFYDKMKEREGSRDDSDQPSVKLFLGPLGQSPMKQNPSILEEKKESTVFVACGEYAALVDNALSYIKDLIESHQRSYTNEDECIQDFDEKEYQELNELQKNLNIAISLDTNKPSIEVLGFGDVTHAQKKIEEMVKRKRLNREQEFLADCVSELVEWQYGDGDTFHPFSKIDNLQLEEARGAKRQTIEAKMNQQTYKVDLSTYTATGAQGHTLSVRRLRKSGVEFPMHWSDMGQQKVLVVPLHPADPEYITVATKFDQTCANFKIEKIERIQNPDLWNTYQIQKRNMDAKNGLMENEKQLFRVVDADSVPHINTNGFNRSFSGTNVVAFGKGTLFAVKAMHSVLAIYSRPDMNGKKYMYYVKVLTGMYTVGDKSLIEPPLKNPQDPTDRYDTITDNVQNPNFFVVFHDGQSYPEYLITFRQ